MFIEVHQLETKKVSDLLQRIRGTIVWSTNALGLLFLIRFCTFHGIWDKLPSQTKSHKWLVRRLQPYQREKMFLFLFLFLWHILLDIFSTNVWLNRRGMENNNLCPWDNTEAECIGYIIRRCGSFIKITHVLEVVRWTPLPSTTLKRLREAAPKLWEPIG